jgi:hypothetical protein
MFQTKPGVKYLQLIVLQVHIFGFTEILQINNLPRLKELTKIRSRMVVISLLQEN